MANLQRSVFTSKYTEHGNKTEKTALQSLFDKIKPKKVYKSGLIISQIFPFLAGTPDAIILDADNYRCVVEVKCPETIVSKSKTLDQFPWFDIDAKGKPCLKETHAYFYQVQFQMFLAKCDYAYFYIYSPSLKLDLKISRKDQFIWKELRTLGRWYFDELLPKISLLEKPGADANPGAVPITAEALEAALAAANADPDDPDDLDVYIQDVYEVSEAEDGYGID